MVFDGVKKYSFRGEIVDATKIRMGVWLEECRGGVKSIRECNLNCVKNYQVQVRQSTFWKGTSGLDGKKRWIFRHRTPQLVFKIISSPSRTT